jgi:hypothetical protein
LKIFRPGVEACLKVALGVVMLVAVFLPLAWGYRQHADAQAWRQIACTYRLKEALRNRLISAADLNSRPCARLAELGLSLERPVMLPGARAAAFDDGLWPSASVSD